MAQRHVTHSLQVAMLRDPGRARKAGEITRLLHAHANGDRAAIDALIPVVYEELRRIASSRLRGESRGNAFGATALVHEAYLELVEMEVSDWQNRHHFYAVASRVMRNVLIDDAIRQRAQKRGGGHEHVPIRPGDAVVELDAADIIAVHDALSRLESIDERQARVVECRVFGGLTVDETAHALGISPATVGRDWSMARAWLNRELRS